MSYTPMPAHPTTATKSLRGEIRSPLTARSAWRVAGHQEHGAYDYVTQAVRLEELSRGSTRALEARTLGASRTPPASPRKEALGPHFPFRRRAGRMRRPAVFFGHSFRGRAQRTITSSVSRETGNGKVADPPSARFTPRPPGRRTPWCASLRRPSRESWPRRSCFGHPARRGFTRARQARRRVFFAEATARHALVLDEIGELAVAGAPEAVGALAKRGEIQPVHGAVRLASRRARFVALPPTPDLADGRAAVPLPRGPVLYRPRRPGGWSGGPPLGGSTAKTSRRSAHRFRRRYAPAVRNGSAVRAPCPSLLARLKSG